MKILDSIWFNMVGIVRVEDEYDGIKYYIGTIDLNDGGVSEKNDSEHIADWGNTFPNEAGDVLFGEKIAMSIEGRK